MTNIPRFVWNNIAFIFIDLQEKLLIKIPDASSIIARNELLLGAANVLGLPYVTTTQYRKGLGDITGALNQNVISPPLDKTTFSCAADSAISSELDRIGRNQLVLSGVETHICVMQTCLDLIGKGYQVSVAADAVGARSRIDHELGLKRMQAAGAISVTAEMVIYELVGRSDSEAFKKILPLIKRVP